MTAALKAAFEPLTSAKKIARRVGCSVRQARRIVETGAIPAALHEPVAQYLLEEMHRRVADISAAITRIEGRADAEAAAETKGALAPRDRAGAVDRPDGPPRL